MLTETYRSRNGKRTAVIEKGDGARICRVTLTENKKLRSSVRVKSIYTKKAAREVAKEWVS